MLRLQSRSLGRSVCAALLALLLLGGCDLSTEVSVSTDAQSKAELRERVAVLERQLEAQRTRADRLQAEVDQARESNVVTMGGEQVSFRLNEAAAVVLVFLILATAAVLIARIKYAPGPGEPLP